MKLYHIFLALVLCLFSAERAGAVGSTFTASVTSGCSPLVVSFHPDAAACTGCSYSWDFGTGSPATGYTSSSSFIAVGPHVVTLTVTDASGATSSTSVTVTVFPSPTVSFVADDTTVCPGSTVTFTNTSISGVPGAMTSSWNYGDGGTGTGSPATHIYTTPGYQTVSLSAINAQGCTSTLTKTAYVHVLNPPVPNFTSSATSVCNPPGSITVNSTSGGAAPLTYSWSFGDGGTATGASATHPYTTPGSYTVKLIVTDVNGCKDSITRTGYIYVGNINAAFTLPATACVYSNVTFTNTSSTHTSRTWDYGDGGTGITVNGIHAYSAPGTYTVRLIVHNGPCTDTVTHTITITAGPTGSFTINPSQPCPAPAIITYTSTAPAGTTAEWTFAGGGTPTSGAGTPISVTYPTNGTKSITMILTDPATGCKDTVTQALTIYDLNFTASATPLSGCRPLTVGFTTAATTTQPDGLTHPYPYGVASYSWNFGDGTAPGSGAGPTHTYVDSGVYYAIVTATTPNGCVVTDTVKILVGVPPAATFTASPLHLCYNRNAQVRFIATVVTGPIDNYVWNYGDATETTMSDSAYHIYTIPGVWTVTLTPYYHGCAGVPFVRNNYITVDSPKAIISYSVVCSPARRVIFGDSSMGDDTHIWMFGDGATSTLNNPIHDYPLAITYTVTLTTYNANSGCRDTVQRTIDLSQPVPNFTADNTAICKYGSVTFTSSVTGGSASDYAWYVNGVYIPSSDIPIITHEYDIAGLYTMRLVITDQNHCQDTVTKTNYIKVGKPVPNFTVSPTSGCMPLTVTFTDVSTDVAGVTLTHFNWSFGDGGTASVAGTSVTHTYTAAGVYTIADTVTDNIGCKDTAVHPAAITAYNPIPSFTTSTTHPCLNAPVTFNNTSTGATSSTWTFGDGATSTTTSPVHTYTANGTYNITLTVTDAHGCTNTLSLPAYLTVSKPVASFYMDDSISVCAPLLVHFTNTSTGAATSSWAFGDGNISVLSSPSDLYLAPGLFDVRLIVVNAYGCRDTAHRNVNIFGYAGSFTYTPHSGCSPLHVLFSASLTNVPSIIWDFADGTTSAVSSIDTVSHVYTTPGAYVPKLILSDNSGCQNSSIGIDTIKVDAVTPRFTTLPNPVCLGTPFNFVDSSSSYWSTITSWNWTYVGVSNTTSSPSYTFTSAGTYPVNLRVKDAWGCMGIIDKDVIVYPLPVVTADRDTVICVGDSATLHGFGAYTYVWDASPTLGCTSCNPAKAYPIDITTYSVTGTDIHGCVDTSSVTVGLRTHTIARAWGDTAVCYGVPVRIYDTGGYFYKWYPALGLNNNTVFDPIATPPYTTVYTVVARLGSCIPDTDQVTITVYPLPTVEAGPDQRLLAGVNAQLQASGTLIAGYAWSPSYDLSCADCPNPVASMSVMTTYQVEVSSIHNCKASDSVKILIYCDNSQIFVPNTFTPNGDGQNDVFYPRGVGIKIIKSFRIYNRWGELLFEKNNIALNDANSAWDGSYKGAEPHPDVYVYIIDAVCYTGEPVFIKGDVTIIR